MIQPASPQSPSIFYRIFEPHPYLKDYIKCYWHFKIATAASIPFDILPDGYFDMLITFKNGQVVDVQLTGIWNKLITVYYEKDVEIFGVRFRPIALDSFFKLRIDELINDSANLELHDLRLHQQIIVDEWNSLEIKLVHYLDQRFLKLLEMQKINEKAKGIFERIEQSSGIEPIHVISNSMGISSRHIQRIIKELIGMSPKDYSEIVRFRDNLNSIKTNKNDFFGYFDQSHFIRDFKKFAGTTPQNLNICGDVRFLQYFDYRNI